MHNFFIFMSQSVSWRCNLKFQASVVSVFTETDFYIVPLFLRVCTVLSIHIAYHQLEGASKDTPCTLSFILFVKKKSCHCIDFEFILEEIQQHISQCKQADCDSITVTVDFCALCFCDSFSLCYLLLVTCPFLTFLPCRGNLLHMPVHVISEQNDQR